MAPMQPPHRPDSAGLLRDQLLPLTAIAASAIALLIGWELFANRMEYRTAAADGSAGDVARIWGGPLRQPQPAVRWRRADAATAQLLEGELSATRVDVDLATDYRRRGLVEFPGYEATVVGRYEFVNPSRDPAQVAFSVGLPVARESLVLRDLKLLVDGVEDPAATEYAADRIVWTGQLAGGKVVPFRLEYRARGMERFGYELAPRTNGAEGAPGGARPVTAFQLRLAVHGARGALDFPVGTMAPTAQDQQADGTQLLVWDVERLLTSFDVGVILPDSRGVSSALGRLIGKAPFFYLLYGFGLLVALAAVRPLARSLHILGLSVAYFLYFPLASYLTAYLAWPVAAALALAGISGLAVLHAGRFVGAAAAVRVATCQLFFLAVPAGAYLVPAHTGLILVIAGFLALAVALHLLGGAAQRVSREDEAPLQPPVLQTIAVPEGQ